MMLRRKIVTIQLPLAIGLLVCLAAAILSLRFVAQNTQAISSRQIVVHLQAINTHIDTIQSLLLKGKVLQEPCDQKILMLLKQVDERILDAKKDITPLYKSSFESIEARIKKHKALFSSDPQESSKSSMLKDVTKDPALIRKIINSYDEISDAIEKDLHYLQNEALQEDEIFYQWIYNRMKLLSFLAIAFLILAAGLGIVLLRLWLRPIGVLSLAMHRLEEGDLSARSMLKGRDEISQLGEQFNRMAARIAEYRKSSLGDLLHAQQISQAAIDSLPDPVIIIGVDGQILNANHRAEVLLGVSVAANIKEGFSAIEPTIRTTLEAIVQHIFTGKGPYMLPGLEEAVRINLPDSERYFLIRGNPVYNEQGVVHAASILLQDVTKIHRFDQLKSNLVHTLAKELNAPLNALRLALHVCIEKMTGSMTEKQIDLLFSARDNGEKLQSILEELFEFSRIDPDSIDLKINPCSTESILNDAVVQHAGWTSDKGMYLQSRLDGADVVVNADLAKVRIIFDALFHYILTHTPLEPETNLLLIAKSNDKFVRFELIHPSYEFSAEEEAHMFVRSFHASQNTGEDNDAHAKLFWSRQLVWAHGGEIGLENQKQGSLFWFTLLASNRDC